jgi:hypothetical protein
MSEADRKALETALADNIPGSIIIKILRSDGYKTSKDSLYAHVKGECKCQ